MHYLQCAGAQVPVSRVGPAGRGLGVVWDGLMQRWPEQTVALGVAQVKLEEQPRGVQWERWAGGQTHTICGMTGLAQNPPKPPNATQHVINGGHSGD